MKHKLLFCLSLTMASTNFLDAQMAGNSTYNQAAEFDYNSKKAKWGNTNYIFM